MIANIRKTLRKHFFRAVIVRKLEKTHTRHSPPAALKPSDFKRLRQTRDIVTDHKVAYSFNCQRVLNSVIANLFKMNDTNLNMPVDIIRPPSRIKGMTVLDKQQFDDFVTVQGLPIETKHLQTALKYLKKYQLKLAKLKAIVDLDKSDKRYETHKLVILDPAFLVKGSMSEELKEVLATNEIPLHDLETYDLKLSYENWSFADIFKVILPDDHDKLCGFTTVGHIAHFNLRDHVLPYKKIIGEVLLDKLPRLKTVVNKVNTIDSTFRTFQMELLAGEEKYVTIMKENGFTFELDFSKVYWNSRLGTEHALIVNGLKKEDILFDAFAGIGPFAIPASAKGVTVYANDLNPHSYEYLLKNVKHNKCRGPIQCFNLDGREFIQTCVKQQLTELYNFTEQGTCGNIAVVMNLPAMAYTFLDAFHSLLSDSVDQIAADEPLPRVHCYCFTKAEEASSRYGSDTILEVKHRAAGVLQGLALDNIDVRLVRNVSPQKDMMCISFVLTRDILLGRTKEENNGDMEPPQKQARLEQTS